MCVGEREGKKQKEKERVCVHGVRMPDLFLTGSYGQTV